MKHFLKLAGGLNVLPLLHAIQQQPHLWNSPNFRKIFPDSPHRESSDIVIRFTDRSICESSPEKVWETLDVVNYPAWHRLTQAQTMAYDLMRTVEGVRLGRMLIEKIPPGGRVYPHADEGGYAKHYDRYHVALQNLPGASIRVGQETISPKAGDVYWFDRLTEHEAVNNSIDDQILLIIDIRNEK